MEKPDFEALVKNISTEDWDYDLAIAGTSPSGRFSCGKEDVIELLEHVWNTHVVPLESEKKALREENTRLTTNFIEHENAAESPNDHLSYWQYQQFTRAAITKLKEELVTTEKALREENTKCKELSWEAANEISRLKKEIERLKAEVLKEKFPEN